MDIKLILTATVVATLAVAPAMAQAKAPSKAEVEASFRTLSLITSAIETKEVPVPVKNALFGCIYAKPLGEVSAALTKTLNDNPQIDGKDNTQALIVLSRICGAPAPEPKAE
ncbi:MAG: hypothetical protein WA979_12460 [Pacificimonas sp.]